MIIDAHAKFADAQTVTTNSDSPGVVSEHTIDLGVARDLGIGQPMYVVVTVDTTMTSSGSNDNLDVNLITDGDSALGSATTLQKLCTVPQVSVAGTKVFGVIAPGLTYERYLGLLFKTDSGPLTAGAFSAYLVLNSDGIKHYADGYAIS